MSKPRMSTIVDKCNRCRGTGFEPNHRAIGGSLKSLRLESGLTLRGMARSLGVSHGFLCQLEAGRRRWSLVLEERYLKICERAH